MVLAASLSPNSLQRSWSGSDFERGVLALNRVGPVVRRALSSFDMSPQGLETSHDRRAPVLGLGPASVIAPVAPPRSR